MLAASQVQFTLLLVGRTGNGKSSTGNTLLDEPRAFKTGISNGDDVMEFASAFIDGLRIQVMDGTGIGDTGAGAKNDIQLLITHIRETLWRYVLNVNAIVLVLRYGVRYTKQEKDAVELVKSIFGQEVLKSWGVIVMTYGDNFELDNDDDNVKFEDWLKEQRGAFQTLIAECDYRCVLFNNKEKDELKRRAQRDKLIDKIKAIQHRPYSNFEFQEATREHVKIVVANQESNCGDLVKRQDLPSQSHVPAEHSVTLVPAEEYHVTSRPLTRSWFVTWSSIECLALVGVVVTVVSIVTLVFASRYAEF